jgi:hypothetical protein
MRRCEYSGYENDDQAVRCEGCRTKWLVSTRLLRKLDPSSGPPVEPPKPRMLVSVRQRVVMVAGAWVAAAATMACLEWALQVFYPLMIVFFPLALVPVLPVLGRYMSLAGWPYYLVLSGAALASETRTRCYVLCAVLCASLAMNCAGCHYQLHAR